MMRKVPEADLSVSKWRLDYRSLLVCMWIIIFEMNLIGDSNVCKDFKKTMMLHCLGTH